MQFRVLGSTEIVLDEQVASLGGPRQRSLVAMLVLAAPHVVSIDRLVDGIWGEAPPKKPLATLQVFVHNVRKVLAELGGDAARATLVNKPPGYALEIADSDSDVGAFRSFCKQARAAGLDDKAALRLFDDAIAQWRGPALSDVLESPFAGPEATALEDELLRAQEDRIDLELRLGLHADVLGRIQELTRQHPMRERFWGQLMVALYRSDRQADALSAYGEARERLADELGIDPGEALRALEVAVLRQDPGLNAPQVPRQRQRTPDTALRPPAALPIPPTRIVGRAVEEDAITAALRDGSARLVTITGPGGMGKTRLAIEMGERWSDDVRFVSLAEVESANDMLDKLVRAICRSPVGPDEAVDAIATALGTTSSLLILDNLEQLDGAAQVVVALLERTPALRILCTSRRRLGLAAEVEQPLAPLATPVATDLTPADVEASAAVQLFCSRAKATNPGFEITSENAAAISALCRRLDGIPLALELAAAKTRLMAPGALLERLAAGLDLSEAASTDRSRQRSLAATIRWSYDQLPPDAQRLCDRLALFEQSFTLETVEAVCGDDTLPDVLEALSAIVDAGLVRASESRVEVRFEQLRMVRSIALTHLRASVDYDGLRSRWARRLAESAAQWGRDLDGPEALVILGRFEDGLADLEAALEWSTAYGDADVAVTLLDALVDYRIASGRTADGRGAADALGQRADLTPQQRATVALATARLTYHLSDWERTETECRGVLDLIEEDADADSDEAERQRATAHCYLGAALVVSGSPEAGCEHALRAVDQARASGLYSVEVVALSAAAIGAIIGGDPEEERRCYEERLAAVRAHGDRARIADTLNTLAEIALDEAENERAAVLSEEALALTEGLMPPEERDASITLARVAVAEGDLPAARSRLRRGLALSQQTSQELGVAQCLRVAGCLAQKMDDPGTAVRLFAAADGLQPSLGGDEGPVETDLAAGLEAATTALSAARREAEWSLGLTLPMDEVLGAVDRLLE